MLTDLKAMLGQQFTYAYGRAGVLQQVLLSQADVDRLLGARDRSDAEKILTELKLTSYIDQSVHTGEAIVHALEAWVHQEVEQMAGQKSLATFDILWVRDYGPLLSFLLKEYHKLTSEISTEPVFSLGEQKAAQLKAALAGEASDLPVVLINFLDEMKELVEPTPQQIDHAVTRFIASWQLKLAKKSGSRLIRQYVRHLIDLQNIRTALRHYDSAVRADALVPGGTIAVEKLSGDHTEILNAVRTSPLYTLANHIETVTEDPIALERACADIIASDIAAMWSVALSIEPIFAFAALTTNNLHLIRTILIGKGNGLSPQELKQILPPFIPASHF